MELLVNCARAADRTEGASGELEVKTEESLLLIQCIGWKISIFSIFDLVGACDHRLF